MLKKVKEIILKEILKPINSKDQIILGIVAVVFANYNWCSGFLFLSPTFERVSPKVNIEKNFIGIYKSQ